MNEKEELIVFRRAFKKLAKYLESVNEGYSFRFDEDKVDVLGIVVFLKVKTPKSKKWRIIEHWPEKTDNPLCAYKDMFNFLCRNMAIQIDDYSITETDGERGDSIVMTQTDSRIRKYIIIPCYTNIVDMVMKMGLKGIDLT